MKNYKDWRGCDFSDFVKPGDEIDEEMYHYFMEVVPPIYFHHGFLCGEPSTHLMGEAVHDAFIFIDNKYRYIGELTVNEAKAIGRFLHNVF